MLMICDNACLSTFNSLLSIPLELLLSPDAELTPDVVEMVEMVLAALE